MKNVLKSLLETEKKQTSLNHIYNILFKLKFVHNNYSFINYAIIDSYYENDKIIAIIILMILNQINLPQIQKICY